jgi:hypothetical protein
MAEICDRSLPPFEASNAPIAEWAQAVARAGRRAAESADRAAALAAILDEMRAATGAQRAFLLEAAPGARRGRVLAATATVLSEGISWSVAARALAGERSLALFDLGTEEGGCDAASVRALALRAAVTVPVPRPAGPRAAIVLDSRAPLELDGRHWDAASRSFAALTSLVLRAGEERAAPATGIPARPVLGGGSAAAVRLRDEIALAAPLPLSVLVLGASGTGKELVARALHEASPRRNGPWVAINCAAIPDSLLERELFGAVRGAYTGADRDHVGLFRQAGGGTLFLDEIGDLSADAQAKLLRTLETDLSTLRARPTTAPGAKPETSDVELPASESAASGKLTEAGALERADHPDLGGADGRTEAVPFTCWACEEAEKAVGRCALPCRTSLGLREIGEILPGTCVTGPA